MLLADLKPGQKATILKFSSEELLLKLMEMGCLPGEQVEVVKIAPFSDPISIAVSGYILSLRLDEARQIIVNTLS